MRSGGIAALGALLVTASAVGAGAAPASRADCAAACTALIAECAGACGVYAPFDASCRRGILKRCRRDGVEACATTTSTTTTTTHAPTTTHPTTSTRPPTTSTTLPPGFACTSPRPLTIGTTESGDTSIGFDHGPGVGCMQNAEAPDFIYSVTPASNGTLTLSLTSTWDGGLYVRSSCDDPDTELVCIDQQGENATEVLHLDVVGGTTYYVYVDGYTSESSGPYELDSQLE